MKMTPRLQTLDVFTWPCSFEISSATVINRECQETVTVGPTFIVLNIIADETQYVEALVICATTGMIYVDGFPKKSHTDCHEVATK